MSLWPMLPFLMCDNLVEVGLGDTSPRKPSVPMRVRCVQHTDSSSSGTMSHSSLCNPDIGWSVSAAFRWNSLSVPNSTFKNPPNLYRCMKGVYFFELIFPLGSTSSHSVMVPQHIDSDVTLIPSSVSSGKQKYTKFKHMINSVSGVDCPEELTWVGRLMVMTCRVQYTMFYILFKKSPYVFQL